MGRNSPEAQFILTWAKKKISVDYLGGKCKECGCTDAFVLDFHHRDPSEKETEYNTVRNSRWSKIKEELDKCDLLCGNCHTNLHINEKPTDDRSFQNKVVLLEYLDKSCCDSCGWDKYIGGLQFHHRDPKLKKFGIGDIKKRLKSNNIPQDILEEIAKCVVFCVNCHRREHTDMLRIYNLRHAIHAKVLSYKEQKQHSGAQIREWAKTMSYREIERVHGVRKSIVHYYVKGAGKDK